MDLIIGGAYQGKLTLAAREYGLTPVLYAMEPCRDRAALNAVAAQLRCPYLLLEAGSNGTEIVALIRRMSLSACHVVNEKMAKEREQKETFEQLDLFTDYAKKEAKEKEEQKKRERERRMQEALLTIKKKYGKNAVLRGMNFEEGATAKERNGQIGGHQA